DGTSIDDLEEIARSAEIPAEQVMIPADHLLLPNQRLLPAIVVTRNISRATHFVIVWSLHGDFVQVMDPARGRRWIRRRRFLRDLYIGTVRVPASDWREWAASEAFLDPLRRRLRAIGIAASRVEGLVAHAAGAEGWEELAMLDAATRVTAVLVTNGGVSRGVAATRVLEHHLAAARSSRASVPSEYWS